MLEKIDFLSETCVLPGWANYDDDWDARDDMREDINFKGADIELDLYSVASSLHMAPLLTVCCMYVGSQLLYGMYAMYTL